MVLSERIRVKTESNLAANIIGDEFLLNFGAKFQR